MKTNCLWLIGPCFASVALLSGDFLSADEPVPTGNGQNSKIRTSINNEPPENAERAEEPNKAETEFAEYRSWKPTLPKPVEVANDIATACASFRSAKGRGLKSGPHAGRFVSVYVNPKGRESYLATDPQKFAEGTVIVKEKLQHKNDQHPQELGIMIKRAPGYDADAGDWQFLFVDAKQQVISDILAVANCRSCHQIQSKNDFVYRRARPKSDDAAAHETSK